MTRIKSYIIIAIITSFFSIALKGQEIEQQTEFRLSSSFTKKILPDIKLKLEPEFRWSFGNGFSRYQLNSELNYHPIKILTLSGGYRLIGLPNDGSTTVFYHRYQFDTKIQKEINDWSPGVQLGFTNYADDYHLDEEKKFLKLKFLLDYDIPNCKLTPEINFQLYHQLSTGSMYKYRTKLGLNYKLKKKLDLFAAYKFDFYKTQMKNRHVIETGLKIKL